MPLQNGTVDLQRVAITRRSKSSPVLYRVFTTIAVTYFVARTINYVYPDSAHGSKASAEVANDVSKPEDRAKTWQAHWKGANNTVTRTQPEVIHLMLPIWIRKQKPEPWKPDDPTWKSFQALDSDKKRLKEILETIKKPLMKAILIKYGRIMMELSPEQSGGGHRLTSHESWRLAPPLYAPATYEIPCVFLEPHKTSYGWRQVPNSVGAKMDRVFHPIVLAKAFYYGVEEFAWASYLITKARLMDRYNALRANENNTDSPQGSLTEDEKALKRLTFGRVSEKNKDTWLPFLRGEYGDHEPRKAYRDLVKSMTYQGAIESACAVFRAHWIQGQEKSMQSHSRDSVILRGNIAFVGEKGTLFLHAVAVYSPETNSLIGPPTIKDAYLSPNMEKWVQQEAPKETTKGAALQVQPKEQTKAVPEETLKPRAQQDDPLGAEKSTQDETEVKDREK